MTGNNVNWLWLFWGLVPVILIHLYTTHASKMSCTVRVLFYNQINFIEDLMLKFCIIKWIKSTLIGHANVITLPTFVCKHCIIHVIHERECWKHSIIPALQVTGNCLDLQNKGLTKMEVFLRSPKKVCAKWISLAIFSQSLNTLVHMYVTHESSNASNSPSFLHTYMFYASYVHLQFPSSVVNLCLECCLHQK